MTENELDLAGQREVVNSLDPTSVSTLWFASSTIGRIYPNDEKARLCDMINDSLRFIYKIIDLINTSGLYKKSQIDGFRSNLKRILTAADQLSEKEINTEQFIKIYSDKAVAIKSIFQKLQLQTLIDIFLDATQDIKKLINKIHDQTSEGAQARPLFRDFGTSKRSVSAQISAIQKTKSIRSAHELYDKVQSFGNISIDYVKCAPNADTLLNELLPLIESSQNKALVIKIYFILEDLQETIDKNGTKYLSFTDPESSKEAISNALDDIEPSFTALKRDYTNIKRAYDTGNQLELNNLLQTFCTKAEKIINDRKSLFMSIHIDMRTIGQIIIRLDSAIECNTKSKDAQELNGKLKEIYVEYCSLHQFTREELERAVQLLHSIIKKYDDMDFGPHTMRALMMDREIRIILVRLKENMSTVLDKLQYLISINNFIDCYNLSQPPAKVNPLNSTLSTACSELTTEYCPSFNNPKVMIGAKERNLLNLLLNEIEERGLKMTNDDGFTIDSTGLYAPDISMLFRELQQNISLNRDRYSDVFIEKVYSITHGPSNEQEVFDALTEALKVKCTADTNNRSNENFNNVVTALQQIHRTFIILCSIDYFGIAPFGNSIMAMYARTFASLLTGNDILKLHIAIPANKDIISSATEKISSFFSIDHNGNEVEELRNSIRLQIGPFLKFVTENYSPELEPVVKFCFEFENKHCDINMLDILSAQTIDLLDPIQNEIAKEFKRTLEAYQKESNFHSDVSTYQEFLMAFFGSFAPMGSKHQQTKFPFELLNQLINRCIDIDFISSTTSLDISGDGLCAITEGFSKFCFSLSYDFDEFISPILNDVINIIQFDHPSTYHAAQWFERIAYGSFDTNSVIQLLLTALNGESNELIVKAFHLSEVLRFIKLRDEIGFKLAVENREPKASYAIHTLKQLNMKNYIMGFTSSVIYFFVVVGNNDRELISACASLRRVAKHLNPCEKPFPSQVKDFDNSLSFIQSKINNIDSSPLYNKSMSLIRAFLLNANPDYYDSILTSFNAFMHAQIPTENMFIELFNYIHSFITDPSQNWIQENLDQVASIITSIALLKRIKPDFNSFLSFLVSSIESVPLMKPLFLLFVNPKPNRLSLLPLQFAIEHGNNNFGMFCVTVQGSVVPLNQEITPFDFSQYKIKAPDVVIDKSKQEAMIRMLSQESEEKKRFTEKGGGDQRIQAKVAQLATVKKKVSIEEQKNIMLTQKLNDVIHEGEKMVKEVASQLVRTVAEYEDDLREVVQFDRKLKEMFRLLQKRIELKQKMIKQIKLSTDVFIESDKTVKTLTERSGKALEEAAKIRIKKATKNHASLITKLPSINETLNIQNIPTRESAPLPPPKKEDVEEEGEYNDIQSVTSDNETHEDSEQVEDDIAEVEIPMVEAPASLKDLIGPEIPEPIQAAVKRHMDRMEYIHGDTKVLLREIGNMLENDFPGFVQTIRPTETYGSIHNLDLERRARLARDILSS